MKKRLLWIGDAVVSSGFAKCTHETLKAFSGDWDVHVLGLNYQGDPHSYPYPIYPCWSGGDAFGIGRTAALVTKLRPDVVIVQNDPWNIQQYMRKAGNTPLVASMPVDGKNCCGSRLNGLAGAIFWTEFGLKEARLGGYAGPASVVPLGVDLDLFKPLPPREARVRMGLPKELLDAFIIGNVNRNQPRKRLDLTVEYFAQWVRQYDIRDAFLFLHVAPTGDLGYDVSQLMQYYGLSNRLILAEPEIGLGTPEEKLIITYSCFDLQISTSQGEGWGLTTMEGMACGVPQIVPKWSALGEWATAAVPVECTTIAVTPNFVNVIGGVPNREQFISALQELYSRPQEREARMLAGLELVSQPEYRWSAIASRFREAVEEALCPIALVGARGAR
jgi:glycosyltransferase involved in cell wall biosynthesis